MANLNGLLHIPIGNDVDVERTVTNVPSETALDLAWMTIKRYETDGDSAAIISKSITSVPQPGIGQITDSGTGDQSATILFQLTATDTALLDPDWLYWYDCQVKSDTDKIYTVEKGNVIAQLRITQATS